MRTHRARIAGAHWLVFLAAGATLSCGEAVPMLHGQTTSGVGLPCYHAESPVGVPTGEAYVALDYDGMLHEVEVTASEASNVCEGHLLSLEDLSVPRMHRPEDSMPYRRCTERSGLGGSHASPPRTANGPVALMRRSLVEAGARALPNNEPIQPEPPHEDAPALVVDSDGDGAADYLLYEVDVGEASAPEGFSGSRMCLENYALTGGGWQRVYRGCHDSCDAVTY